MAIQKNNAPIPGNLHQNSNVLHHKKKNHMFYVESQKIPGGQNSHEHKGQCWRQSYLVLSGITELW